MSSVLVNPNHNTDVLLFYPEIFRSEPRKSVAVLFYGNRMMDLMLCVTGVSSTNDNISSSVHSG